MSGSDLVTVDKLTMRFGGLTALDELEADLARANLTALVDDRPDSAGIKFKDADLIGIPVRFTLGPRSLEKGGIEVRDRRTGETGVVALAEAAAEARRAR